MALGSRRFSGRDGLYRLRRQELFVADLAGDVRDAASRPDSDSEHALLISLDARLGLPYIAYQYMALHSFDRELKKGSAGLLILSLVEERSRHGYEIGKLIERRSRGALSFNVASLYPLLYRLEARGLVEGRWVEKPGQRRRRYYRITAAGRRVLRQQRSVWRTFVRAMNRVTAAELG